MYAIDTNSKRTKDGTKIDNRVLYLFWISTFEFNREFLILQGETFVAVDGQIVFLCQSFQILS